MSPELNFSPNTHSVSSLQGKPAGDTLMFYGIRYPAGGKDSGKFPDQRLPLNISALQPSFVAKDFPELSYQGIYQRRQTKL